MPSRKQEKQIRDVMTLRQLAMSAILAESARDMSILTANEALSKLQRDRYAVATAEGVTEKIYQNYVKDLNRGGTSCIERVVKDIGDGKVRVTTSRAFVPWLNNMTKRESEEIITLLGDAERNGLYPYATARELKDYFKGTNHNAMTAARTEAAKIRNDARSQSFIDSGVKYVEYVTAGDELVRPEHAMRNGKIYRHEDAPWIGEYNCRCLLVPADYKVEEKEAEVTPNDAEILDKEALMTREPTQTKTPSPDAEPTPINPAQETGELNVNFGQISREFADGVNERILANIEIAPKIRNVVNNVGDFNFAVERCEVEADAIVERLFVECRPEKKFSHLSDAELRIGLRNGLVEHAASIKSKTAWMFFDRAIGGIFVNGERLSAKKIAESLVTLHEDVLSGFHPIGTDTVNAIADHECGHAIDRAYGVSKDAKITKLFNRWMKLDKWEARNALAGYPRKDEFVDNLTYLLRDNPQKTKKFTRADSKAEFIAEAWSEYLNNPNPREYAKAVGDRMMEIIKEAEQ